MESWFSSVVSVGSGESTKETSRPPRKGKIYNDINYLRHKMGNEEPADNVRSQLKDIQCDCKSLGQLLDELCMYIGGPEVESLMHRHCAIRYDLLSLEEEVTDYIRKHETSEDLPLLPRYPEDSSALTNSEAELHSADYVAESDDVQNSINKVQFSKFLLHIADNLYDDDVKRMKFFLDRYIGSYYLQHLSDPKDLIRHLMKVGIFTMNNIIIIQSLLWSCGNVQLFNEVSKKAEEFKEILYFCEPNPESVNGHDRVRLHLKGDPSKKKIESLRNQFACNFGIPTNFVVVVGLERGSSWYITFMIPEMFAEKLESYLSRDWLREQGVDSMELHDEKIDLTVEQDISTEQQEKTTDSAGEQNISSEQHENTTDSTEEKDISTEQHEKTTDSTDEQDISTEQHQKTADSTGEQDISHEQHKKTTDSTGEQDLSTEQHEKTTDSTGKASKQHYSMEGREIEELTSIKKPTLRFTETSHRDLRITEGGSVVEAENLSWMWPGRAVTDGRYQTGRYYWELQITCSPGWFCACDVGVRQESRGVGEDPKPDHDSWYVGMRYCGDEVRCYSDCGGEVSPEYGQWGPYRRPHHLGVYLDCDQHTLTVVDCTRNQVMATVRGVVVTEPLRPWLRFDVPGSVSVRLVPGDSVTLPQVLSDMLNTS